MTSYKQSLSHLLPDIRILKNLKGNNVQKYNSDNMNMWDTTEDSNRNIIWRSSTASIPLTETSKRIQSVRDSQNNMDMPLQRNFSDLNWQEVSPILEDEKGEETVFGDIDNKSPVMKRKNLYKHFSGKKYWKSRQAKGNRKIMK